MATWNLSVMYDKETIKDIIDVICASVLKYTLSKN